MTLLCRWRSLEGVIAHVMHSDAVTVEAALTKNMYGPEAARGWTMERSWIVPDGVGQTTRGAMERVGA